MSSVPTVPPPPAPAAPPPAKAAAADPAAPPLPPVKLDFFAALLSYLVPGLGQVFQGRDGNKRWDLGWVYTVIAGVLNLLVIYDALAGPLFREYPKPEAKGDDTVKAAAGPDPVPVAGGPAA